jgi:hypothetical protein
MHAGRQTTGTVDRESGRRGRASAPVANGVENVAREYGLCSSVLLTVGVIEALELCGSKAEVDLPSKMVEGVWTGP